MKYVEKFVIFPRFMAIQPKPSGNVILGTVQIWWKQFLLRNVQLAQLMLLFCLQEIFGTEPLISVYLAVNLLGFWWTFTVGFRFA